MDYYFLEKPNLDFCLRAAEGKGPSSCGDLIKMNSIPKKEAGEERKYLRGEEGILCVRPQGREMHTGGRKCPLSGHWVNPVLLERVQPCTTEACAPNMRCFVVPQVGVSLSPGLGLEMQPSCVALLSCLCRHSLCSQSLLMLSSSDLHTLSPSPITLWCLCGWLSLGNQRHSAARILQGVFSDHHSCLVT